MALLQESAPLDILDETSPVITVTSEEPVKAAHEGFLNRWDAKTALRKAGISTPLNEENLPDIFEQVRQRVYTAFDKAHNGHPDYQFEPSKITRTATTQRVLNRNGSPMFVLQTYHNQKWEGQPEVSLVYKQGRYVTEMTEFYGRDPLIRVYKLSHSGKRETFIGAIGGRSTRR